MLCRIHDDDDDDDDDDDPRNVASMQTPDAADIPRTLHRILFAAKAQKIHGIYSFVRNYKAVYSL